MGDLACHLLGCGAACLGRIGTALWCGCGLAVAGRVRCSELHQIAKCCNNIGAGLTGMSLEQAVKRPNLLGLTGA